MNICAVSAQSSEGALTISYDVAHLVSVSFKAEPLAEIAPPLPFTELPMNNDFEKTASALLSTSGAELEFVILFPACGRQITQYVSGHC